MLVPQCWCTNQFPVLLGIPSTSVVADLIAPAQSVNGYGLACGSYDLGYKGCGLSYKGCGLGYEGYGLGHGLGYRAYGLFRKSWPGL